MEITKEQVLELAKYGNKNLLMNWFPEAFRTEFMIGKWYTIDESIFYCTEINKYGNLFGYGVFKGIWREFQNNSSFSCACNSEAAKDRLIEATRSEVEAALIAEAEKRGYKEGVQIIWSNKPGLNYTLEYAEFEYWENPIRLMFGDYAVMDRGIWAEILPEEKTVISKEKALKIVAKKLKISPENLEIK